MFGLDIKTAIIVAILLLFVLPFIRAQLLTHSSRQAKAAQ